MRLAISDFRPADPRLWDHAWQGCPYATYFHSREWAELWNDYTGGRVQPAPLEVTFTDGRVAVVALSRERGRVRTQHVSSYAGTYGGWVSADALTAEHRRELALFMVRELGDVAWRLNPFDSAEPPQGVGELAREETQALSLDGDCRAIAKRWTKGHRSAVGKARREGVTVSPAETRADWSDFAEIYADSVRRWGDRASSSYEPRLIELIRARDSRHVRLWLARYEGRSVAGALCLYAGAHVSYWLGGALDQFFPLRPVHLLMHEAIEHACESGHAWFDFNPSGGHEGVAAFKKGFGAAYLPAPMITRTSRLTRAGTTARRLLRQ